MPCPNSTQESLHFSLAYQILRQAGNVILFMIKLIFTSTACSVFSEEANTHSFGPAVLTELYKSCWFPTWSYADGQQEAVQGCAQATVAATMQPGCC